MYLWQSDPFKAKWALVAKAYSVIRDHVGKENAPLNDFLSLVAELVGILDPTSYLVTMGWVITVNEVGYVSLEKNAADEIGIGMLSTNVSVEDIILHAAAHGYVAKGLVNKGLASQPSMTMAASAQSMPLKTPGSGITTSSRTIKRNQVSSGIAGPSTDFGLSQVASGECSEELNLIRSLTAISLQKAKANADRATLPRTLPISPSANTGLSANQSALNSAAHLGPNVGQPVFMPNGGNAFDAFDISEWVNLDANAV